jgi:nitrite reductase/ring-hydroxylating ferredoxin subunit/uncharacterized membrane protein
MSEVDMNHRDLSAMEPLVAAIESAGMLDQPATLLSRAVRGVLSPGKVKDALSGTWLGHALHPMLTDVVIGSFLSASALDLVAGEDGQTASERLIMVGIAAYGPTAAAGASDWIDGEHDDRVKRVGIVHAGGNLLALSLYLASLAARRRGEHGQGKLLAVGGASMLMVGGYLGGHLSLRRGIGVDQTVFDPGSDDWRPAADASQLPEGRPTRVVVDETPVLLLRSGERIYAIHDRCSHRGCSLADGTVEGEEIVCACHFSRFDLRDGSVTRGPATAPQPAFQVRDRAGVLEVRRIG